jgi:plastocyanin
MRFFLAILTLLFLVFTPLGQETPQKPVYRPAGNEATLIGSIFVNGEIPRRLKYDMSADPICERLNHPQALTDDVLTTDEGLLNVVVYVKSGGPLDSYRFEVPASEVVLERRKCQFVPHVLGVRAGQKVSFVTSDPTQHNTHPTPKLNLEWNQTQAPGGEPIVKAFNRPEQFIRVKCNQHPWEQAFVGVFSHPFFVITDQFGNYEIRGLPPGTYKLVAWHQKLGEQEMEITIAPGESRRIDFTFEVLEKHRSIGGNSQIPQTPAVLAGSSPGK